jgi:hypothetical protein
MRYRSVLGSARAWLLAMVALAIANFLCKEHCGEAPQ